METAVELKENPLQWVLTGGEDHSLLSTFPASQILPEGFVRIGSVVSVDAAKSAVTVDGQNFEGAEAGALGWDHFAV